METKHAYCVYNQTREAFLSLRTLRADTPSARLLGLLGRMTLRSDEAVWLLPSQGVHTIGLLFPIDLVYLDARLQVVSVVEHLKPFRLSPICLRSTSVLELPAHAIYSSKTVIGDQLLICPPQEIGLYLRRIQKKGICA